MKISIAPDFEHLLPALSDSEAAQLKANCEADPNHERMPAVLVWSNHKNTIIDGHNQHRIRERLRLKIKYAKLDFDTRDDAFRYALDVQFGRRNCDASQRAIAYAKLPRNSHGGTRKADSDQVLNSTLENLAEKAGVGVSTMRAAAVVVDKSAAPIVKAVESGDVKASDAAAIADLPKAEQTAALKKVKSGEAKTLRGAAFDPKQLDAQSPRKETKPRAGKPTVSTKQRKDCLALHAKLCRALQAIGIYDEFITSLSQIAERLKKI